MTAYFGIFKEPRGLIRLLQFIFAIFAFATACNGSSSLYINNTSGQQLATADWSYPYNLKNTPISYANNTDSGQSLSSSNDIKSSAEFFVFTGVTSMLLSFAFAILYVIMDRQYRNDERFPIVDLFITVIWTIFWIAGSSAWAQGVSNIRSQTSWSNAAKLLPDCSPNNANCPSGSSGTYANVIVSVIFGFLNFFLWASCIWFVYKETKFFKSRTAQQQPQQNNFSNIGPSGMHQPSNTQMPGSMG
ncbi:unnamed protein product [Adineta steineri]|uniref:MARVEL domain-containing protein n=1 Tax=Adineta steineri TaxID=433720 RepID=A0A815ZH93_9BILA|nr:unnamed protein product [Adineta steineri]CAF1583219.1 unnamed protein product [Adineta steineri]